VVSGYEEIWSAQTLNAYLQTKLEIPVEWIDEGASSIVMGTGFVASTIDGVPTPLKRSGSDYSDKQRYDVRISNFKLIRSISKQRYDVRILNFKLISSISKQRYDVQILNFKLIRSISKQRYDIRITQDRTAKTVL